MGFPIFDDPDCEEVWRAAGGLTEEWRDSRFRDRRGARFDALRKELEWPGKRLARHLRHCLARGSLRRVEVSRRNVRYEQADSGSAFGRAMERANEAWLAYAREEDRISRLRKFAGFPGTTPMEMEGMARQLLRPRSFLYALNALARLAPVRRKRGRPRHGLVLLPDGRTRRGGRVILGGEEAAAWLDWLDSIGQSRK